MICAFHSAARRLAAATLGGCLLLAALPCRAASPPTDAELKAVLLFHLTQFVTWPAVSTNESPDFVIGILGPDPFGPALDEVAKGEKVGNRPIRVVRANRVRELNGCSLVYVSPQARERLARIFQELRGPPALTVGETADFLDEGGMVRFRRMPERKVRLQINLQRARQSGFNISAQLLRVCDVVQGENK